MNDRLYRYSQFTVLAAFTLILIGSLVTTTGAGMAFADWPLSSGSLNPDGWWSHLFQRLEHGHRLFAELTGLLVGILCAWVWGNRWALPVAIAVSGSLSAAASAAGISAPWIAHIGLWSAALFFAGVLLLGIKDSARLRDPLPRWLAFAAFCGVVVQAILGGLRVTVESGGHVEQAMVIRIVHGCFAQIELCLLVAVAATLSPKWGAVSPVPGLSRIRRLAWLTFGFVFLQLTLGAAIRHLGIALVIPTFPLASSHG
ncbi:MAG: COX15/CtaA family protein, partial [Verrucomicrobiota bacterium]